MSLTPQQKLNVIEAHGALKSRGMVYFSGRQNGKTRAISRTLETVPVAEGRRTTLRARHKEDNDIEFVSGIFYGRSDKITPYSFMRTIIQTLGQKPARGFWEITTQFSDMLWNDFERQQRVLCLSVDNAELLCARAYTILKYLNEIRRERKDIGCAVMLAGEYGMMKMPMPFLKRCTEIEVGRISAEDIAQLIETHWPGEASGFTKPAIERILYQSETTLEVRQNLSRVIAKRRAIDEEIVDVDIVNLALAA